MAYIQERKNKNGTIGYRVQVRLKGYPLKTATFSKKTDARRWAQKVETKLRENRHFPDWKKETRTLGEAIDKYLNEGHHKQIKDFKKQEAHLLWWKKELGVVSLNQLTPFLIAERRDYLLASHTFKHRPRSPSTVARYLSSLSAMFSTVCKEWGWIESSPLKNLTFPKENKGRTRFLSPQERKRLLDECKKSSHEFLTTIVLLALYTGMRSGEIRKLKWEDIDLERNMIIVRDTKNGETRAVPLVCEARKSILHLKSKEKIHPQDLLFPPKKGKNLSVFRYAWEKALRNASIENFRFHDLRHSFGSYLAMSGSSVNEISEMLGHKTLQMVKRYAHLCDSHLSKVIERMSKKMIEEKF